MPLMILIEWRSHDVLEVSDDSGSFISISNCEMGGRKSSKRNKTKTNTINTKKGSENSKTSLLRGSGVFEFSNGMKQKLNEAAVDVKENIPISRTALNTKLPEDVNTFPRRKRRSSQMGPAPKRPSIEKEEEEESKIIGDSLLQAVNSVKTTDSSCSTSKTKEIVSRRRPPSRPLPIVEEDEVFSGENEDCVEERREGLSSSLSTEDVEEEHLEDEDDEPPEPLQNPNFEKMERALNEERKGEVLFVPPQLSRVQSYGSPKKVWSLLVRRDEIPRPTQNLMRDHPQMSPNTRAVLVDWMMEVCETERQHRETFHLAVDYVDRFLESGIQEVTPKTFQLVGTTALFIASKYEEIYPPKCQEFAGYTDGAFSSQAVRQMETIMVRALNWALSSLTSVHWLATYMQLLGKKEVEQELCGDEHIVEERSSIPNFMREDFIHMAKILDLLLLDTGSFKFSYRTVAAAVLFACYEPHRMVEQVTGYSYERLYSAIQFVEPYVAVLEARRLPGDPLPQVDKIPSSEVHRYQTRMDFDGLDDIMRLVEEERKNRVPFPTPRRVLPTGYSNLA
ncbi:unnamed protein product [Caenorhabditis auriculariae]|uniref:Cyclin-like domain-containing protein n=1 Tax=Caenorhabditis auriculariae TaxID=2777116 RepID=A0A8S1H715_9PELO|nr:unnamed protein product [Caenorhabditis auriculariae]